MVVVFFNAVFQSPATSRCPLKVSAVLQPMNLGWPHKKTAGRLSIWPNTVSLTDSHCGFHVRKLSNSVLKALQAKAWHAFLTSKFFYIQDGIWKWHCFDAETWEERDENPLLYWRNEIVPVCVRACVCVDGTCSEWWESTFRNVGWMWESD